MIFIRKLLKRIRDLSNMKHDETKIKYAEHIVQQEHKRIIGKLYDIQFDVLDMSDDEMGNLLERLGINN
jgi:hypothetical protein